VLQKRTNWGHQVKLPFRRRPDAERLAQRQDLYVMAGLYLMAAVCWLFIRADRPIEETAVVRG
jgi:hypothetical protein